MFCEHRTIFFIFATSLTDSTSRFYHISLEKTVLRAVLGFFLPPNRSFDLFPLLALSRHKRGVIPNLAGQTPR